MAVLPPDPVFSLRSAEMGPVHSLAFHSLPGGLERLLAGTQTGHVLAWDMQTNRLQQKFTLGKQSILKIHHTDDSVLAQEKGGTLHIRKLTESGYTDEATIIFPHAGFCGFEISEENNILIIPGESSKIDILDLNGSKVRSFESSSDNLGEVMCFKQLDIADTPYLIAGYESGVLILWDIKSGRRVSSTKLRECPLSIDYDLITNRGLAVNTSEFIDVFTINRLNLSLSFKIDILIKNAGVNRVKIRSDKKVFVSAGWDGRIRIFSWKSLRPLAVLTEHKSAIQDIVFSDKPLPLWNANIMAAGSLDGSITLWDLYN